MKKTSSEILFVTVICIFYGMIAFYQLGIRHTPVTEYRLSAGECIVLNLRPDTTVRSLNWYVKDTSNVHLLAESKEHTFDINIDTVFSWDSCTLDDTTEVLRLTNQSADAAIAELVLLDENGNVIRPANAAAYSALFDETEWFPDVIDYQSGAYFDEIYYTRTAYEFLNGLPAYENTHPPLGKILIAPGVMLWGSSPFGFRFMGTLFGILMLPFVYLLGRDLTGSRRLGAFGCFLFAFDFMHFTQTRIATIDVFITFFTIVMYYFMYRYSRCRFYETSLYKTFLPLGICGVAFGMGIACKWTGFYAGIGLAILFVRVLVLRHREYRTAVNDPNGTTGNIPHALIIRHYREYTQKTICFCIVFFLIIPFVIYLLSYIPFSDGTDAGLFTRMWNNQMYILQYHTGLNATHPYASPWYQWPVMVRPVFYYSRVIDDTMRQGISAFGNPLVWWTGIFAFLHVLMLRVKKAAYSADFLYIAYLSCFLPWCFVSRCTFAYHYFPCVPFVACMIAYSFGQLRTYLRNKNFTLLLIVYSGLTFALFLLFYPVLSGHPVSVTYVDHVLRWFDSWALVR